jgi:hypothetical protein
LFGGRLDLGHVADDGAEGEEIGPEFLIEEDIGGEMFEVLGVPAADLVTLAEVDEVAYEL